jgi:hypothetical protein
MHITTVMDKAHRLTELSDHHTTIKGIKHGKLENIGVIFRENDQKRVVS